MARLELEPVLKDFYGKKDNLNTAKALRRRSKRLANTNRAASPPATFGAGSDDDAAGADDSGTGRGADSGPVLVGEFDADPGSDTANGASRQDALLTSEGEGGEAEQRPSTDDGSGDGGDGGDGSSSGSMDSSSDARSSSDGASDLEGLPLASATDEVEQRAARDRAKQKRHKPVSQPITAEGAQADKLGLAFQRILQKDTKPGAVLAGSKSLQKRKREEEDEEEAAKKRKLKRIEMKQRGHLKVLRKGQDPEADAIEKAHMRTATRAVVQLFNAISQAQKSQRQAQEAGVKEKDAVKQTKAALLQVLKPDKPTAEHKAPGWQILQDGFTGTEKAAKMKDWEKDLEQEDPHAPDEIVDEGDSDEDFGDW